MQRITAQASQWTLENAPKFWNSYMWLYTAVRLWLVTTGKYVLTLKTKPRLRNTSSLDETESSRMSMPFLKYAICYSEVALSANFSTRSSSFCLPNQECARFWWTNEENKHCGPQTSRSPGDDQTNIDHAKLCPHLTKAQGSEPQSHDNHNPHIQCKQTF